jgi:hypothetical protein
MSRTWFSDFFVSSPHCFLFWFHVKYLKTALFVFSKSENESLLISVCEESSYIFTCKGVGQITLSVVLVLQSREVW